MLTASATADAARARHEIDDYFVGDSHYGVTAEIVVGHVRDGVVFEDLQRRTHARNIVWRSVDQENYVLRGTGGAISDDGEAADEDIADAVRFQRACESDEVFELRLTCVRAIMRIIHASASSKVAKR